MCQQHWRSCGGRRINQHAIRCTANVHSIYHRRAVVIVAAAVVVIVVIVDVDVAVAVAVTQVGAIVGDGVIVIVFPVNLLLLRSRCDEQVRQLLFCRNVGERRVLLQKFIDLQITLNQLLIQALGKTKAKNYVSKKKT